MPASTPESTFLDERVRSALGDVAAAVETGAGVPELARAAGRALNAGVAVIDSASSILAVASASPADERALLAAGEGTEVLELRAGGVRTGELRLRPRGAAPPPELTGLIRALIAVEVDRARAPDRATDAAVTTFLHDLFERRLTDRGDILARGQELGSGLEEGGAVVLVRARPHQPVEGDWRARVISMVARGARGVARDALIGPAPPAPADGEPGRDDALVLVPGSDPERARRTAAAVTRELESSLGGYSVAVARSRQATDPVDLHRAAAEALLAANVAEASGATELGFEETGSYRLLLSAVSDDPAELRSFHDETIGPLAAYDDEYETQLLRTLETYLDADGSVASSAQRLFTHRHTIRYRLERIRDLTGLDVSSSDGRERLSLGLKAMRVLGLGPPGGPATEPGAEAGRVRREGKDR